MELRDVKLSGENLQISTVYAPILEKVENVLFSAQAFKMDVIAQLNKCTEDSGEAPHLSERMIMPVGNECVLCFRRK